MNTKQTKEKTEKKKRLPLGKTAANCAFALKMLWHASPLYVVVYLGSSVLYGTLGFLSETYMLRKIVNGLEAGQDVGGLIRYVLILGCICLAVDLGMRWFWNISSSVEYRKINAYVDKTLFAQAARVELACYEDPAFYDKYVKAMDAAYDRMMKVLYALDSLISRIIALSANSILLFIIDPWLILFGLFPLVLGVFRRLENIAQHDLDSEKKTVRRRANYVKRTFYLGEYAKEMRIGGMYENMLRDLEGTYHDFCRLTRKYGLVKAIYGYIQKIGLEVVTILGATLYAVWRTMCIGAANGGMMVGDCIVVLSSISTISYCLNNLVQNVAQFGEHALFLEDVRFFLDYTPTITDGPEIAPAAGGEIELRNVSFRYTGSERDALKDVSFVWHKGERIALVGSNGSGKSTLVKLLLRLYDPDAGEISVNGKNIRDFSLSSYRSRFSTVFQDVRLFSLSVRDNVLLRPAEDGDDARIAEALRESGASEKVERFEHGLDTILTREFDDKGENLSGGEAQKLALAGVFAGDAPFVVLDEPSSALDPIAECTMFENMMRATAGKSVIFISHRLSSAVLADRVILMDDGRIAEIGTHAELMAKKGKYAAMFSRQAENYLGSEVYAHE